MNKHEEFVDYYHLSNILKSARRDIRGYFDSNLFWFWLISIIGFIMISIAAIFKGVTSLVFILSGLPLALSWTIYIIMTQSTVSWRQQINDYLDRMYNEPDWSNFVNYITAQYVLEDSKPLWRTGYAATWLSLAIGQLISYLIGDNKSPLNYEATSFMFNSAIAIIAFLFFIENIYPRRKTRLHLAIKDIKKFQARRSSFRA